MVKVKAKRVKPYTGLLQRATARLFVLLVIFTLSACTTAPWQFASLDGIQTQVTTSISTLPAYDLTAAEWVPNQPLLVNKDFNFGMAMSMEGVGVAIAAGMRINKNKELAETLSTMPPLLLDQHWQQAAAALKGPLRDKQVLVFAMLYGRPQAHLRTIVEFHNGDSEPTRYIDYSDWLPIAGEGSWTENNGAMVQQISQQSLMAITELISNKQTALGKEIDYTINGGEAVQRGSGYVFSKDDTHTTVKSTTIPNTVLRIPTGNFKKMEKIPEPVLEERAELTKRGD